MQFPEQGVLYSNGRGEGGKIGNGWYIVLYPTYKRFVESYMAFLLGFGKANKDDISFDIPSFIFKKGPT